MDKGTLYNLALSYLGDRQYKTDAATAAACDGCGAHCVALALDYTPWSFATVSSTLTLTDGAAELPHDCLRLQSVGLKKFALRGRRLTDLTGGDSSSTEITYTTNIWAQNVSVPDNQPTFAEGVALLIASKTAPRLTGNLQLASELEQKAYQALARAKYKDAQSIDSNDQEPDNHSLISTWGTM